MPRVLFVKIFFVFFFSKRQAKQSFQDRLLIYTFQAVTALWRVVRGEDSILGVSTLQPHALGSSLRPCWGRVLVLQLVNPHLWEANSATHPLEGAHFTSKC